jgi:hypothetical protein
MKLHTFKYPMGKGMASHPGDTSGSDDNGDWERLNTIEIGEGVEERESDSVAAI